MIRSRHASDRSIGAILVDSGKLSIEDVDWILHLQKAENLMFGEAAIKLGLVQPKDIQFALARQLDYPYLLRGEGGVGDEVIAAYQPNDRRVESLRILRSQLMLRWFTGDTNRRALSIVSPSRGEGRSYLAANLAVVFSQLGEHTLLIDGDMHHPRQEHLFNLQGSGGLSDILAGRGELDAVQRVPSLVDLSVLPAGTEHPNPQDLLGRPLFTELLAELSREFSVILIDTPAGLQSSDAHLISHRTGAALLAARRHHSRIADLQGLVNSLAASGVEMVGSAVSEY